MRMLGEMASARPMTGPFVDYARLAFGNLAGFTTGWLYGYFWGIVVGFEAVVGGQIINGWLPGIPGWAIAFGLLLVMTLLNLMSVESFGEAEYWFAGVRIFAILAFPLVTGAYALGFWPNSTASLGNLTAHGGLFPHGVSTLFTSVVVIFSMTGVGVATIAAAESAEPDRNIRCAVNTVIARILIFFVLSTFLIVVAQPWTEIVPGKPPFALTLDEIGIPGLGTILTVVILVAVLSLLNAGLYTSSRLLIALAETGDAPAWLTWLNRRGAPAWTSSPRR